MRYYPCSALLINDFQNKLRDMTLTIRDENWLFTQCGYYKYVKDKLMIFKLNLTNSDQKLKNYVNNTDFVISNNTWKKLKYEKYAIPPLNIKANIKIYTFSPNSQSKFKFIVEVTKFLSSNDSVTEDKIDYYFTSPENSDNHSLKEDISSFLTLLT
tara:strand:+ start:1173 stop:1640 length:468 start_codon:yes stop_codon:yes gene_type:complete